MKPPDVEIVEVVTREHAEKFADRWSEEITGDLEVLAAIGQCGIITWPEDDEAAQGRYQDIEDEILDTVLAMTKGAVTEAFFMAATVILARERAR